MQMKWPKEEILNSKARARVKELRRLTDIYKLNDSDLRIVQNELDILATRINKRKVGKDNNGSV